MLFRSDMQQSDFETRKIIDYLLFKQGIYNKPTNRYSVSVAHDDSVIDFTLQAFRNVLKQL